MHNIIDFLVAMVKHKVKIGVLRKQSLIMHNIIDFLVAMVKHKVKIYQQRGDLLYTNINLNCIIISVKLGCALIFLHTDRSQP